MIFYCIGQLLRSYRQRNLVVLARIAREFSSAATVSLQSDKPLSFAGRWPAFLGVAARIARCMHFLLQSFAKRLNNIRKQKNSQKGKKTSFPYCYGSAQKNAGRRGMGGGGVWKISCMNEGCQGIG